MNRTKEKETLEVAAGILVKDGKVLLARRAKGQHQAGKWEFPGGKIEPGETPEECLRREFMEELEVMVDVGEFVADSICMCNGKRLRLSAYLLTERGGSLVAHVHDQIEWLPPERVREKDLAPADIPIAERLAGLKI